MQLSGHRSRVPPLLQRNKLKLLNGFVIVLIFTFLSFSHSFISLSTVVTDSLCENSAACWHCAFRTLDQFVIICMAPRRGGGGGVASSDYSSDDSGPSVWTQKTLLFGSNFHDHYTVAEIAIIALALFGLLVVAIWSLTIRKRSNESRAIFQIYRFGIAMLFTLV